MRILSILIVLCFAAFAAQGQSVYRTYPGSFRTLTPAPDDGFFIAGHRAVDSSLQLRRVDAQGNTIWERFWVDRGRFPKLACAHPAGGYVVFTEDIVQWTQVITLLRVSEAGTFVWQKEITVPGLLLLSSLSPTNDGGFLAVGTYMENQQTDTWLVKFDTDGNILWQKAVQTPEAVNNAKGIVLSDGDILIGGDRKVSNEHELYLMRTDANGNLRWSTNYAIPEVQTIDDIAVTPDGGFALMGNTYLTTPKLITFVKTDPNGTLEWFRQFYPGDIDNQGGGGFFNAYSFATDADGHFYIPVVFPSQNNALRLFYLDGQGHPAAPPQLLGQGHPLAMTKEASQGIVIVGEIGIPDTAFFLKTATATDFGHIIGHAFLDGNSNCTEEPSEISFVHAVVEARDAAGGRYFAGTQADGSFDLWVPTGTYDIVLHPPHRAPTGFWDPCPGPMGLSVATGDSVQAGNLGLRPLAYCPLLDVSVSSGLLRRCTTAWYQVEYCNLGTQTAENVRVELVLDTLLNYVQGSVPLSGQVGNRLVFSLPDLPVGTCEVFQVQLNVSCAALNGQALCVDAYIFPDSVCVGSPGDGARIAVNGACQNNQVEFLVQNIGPGDMGDVAEYVIIEDQIMYHMGSFRLNAGEDTLIRVPNPSGRTYFLQARPANSQRRPSAVVQWCAGTGGASPLNYPYNSNGLATDVYCAEVRGSFDPNDIQGFPLGIGADNHIEPDQNLNYRIRFQNTGNDTAFLVVIRDTLPAELDPATVRPGPSSHPYTFDLREGGILTFTFRNILLPDSNTNEAASHGYVTYRISPLPGLPRDTRLLNRAGIYFDFNDPVITNTARHTIWKPLFTSVRPDPPRPQDWSVQVSPNPTNGPLFFQLPPQAPREGVQLLLFSAQGTLVQQTTCPNGTCHLDTAQLPQGPYWYALRDGQGVWRAKGRVVVFK